MQDVAAASALSELEFAEFVDSLAADAEGQHRLTELLCENHPVYDQRGTATVVRMRGWVLIALSRIGVSRGALPFVIEELDTGIDPYLVAAAARALRSYPEPTAALALFAVRAVANIRYRDEPVSFGGYGEYAVSSTGTSPVRELLAVLEWLGPLARGVLPELEALRVAPTGLPKKLAPLVDRAVAAVRGANPVEAPDAEVCCSLPGGLGKALEWPSGLRRGSQSIEGVTFEDQDGQSVRFTEFFRGQPSIVVFFYTRCDNPLKCSLTVTKLGRIQELLKARGLDDEIRTAAVTYDPAFDLADRLRRYGEARGVRLDARHRMLRTTDGVAALRAHLELGVNFVESLVNRHRIELFVLDAQGRVAARYERIRWDEHTVVDRAIDVLNEAVRIAEVPPTRTPAAWPALASFASVAVALLPKCPVCWTAYLSMFGIVGIGQTPYFTVLRPLLLGLVLLNVASVWLRARATGRMVSAYLVAAGAVAMIASQFWPGVGSAAPWGAALTLAGSLLSVANARAK